MKKILNQTAFSDYIYIIPEGAEGGNFIVEDFKKEEGTIHSVGPKVSKEVKALVGKKVAFNAWACDEKKSNNITFFSAPESANVICGLCV